MPHHSSAEAVFFHVTVRVRPAVPSWPHTSLRAKQSFEKK